MALLAKLVQEHQPDIVLAGATTAGRELLAGAAADLNAGSLSDVTELTLEGGKLTLVRPVLGGKVLSIEAGDRRWPAVRDAAPACVPGALNRTPAAAVP